MNLEEIRIYCLSKKAATEEFPFDDVTLVFKVMNKIFALMAIDSPVPEINLKCDPEKAIELRERFPCVKPGYHMNKQHWNTVTVDDSASDKLLKEWIDDSYNLIVAKLTKKEKEEISCKL